jgi:hypothetical protein
MKKYTFVTLPLAAISTLFAAIIIGYVLGGKIGFVTGSGSTSIGSDLVLSIFTIYAAIVLGIFSYLSTKKQSNNHAYKLLIKVVFVEWMISFIMLMSVGVPNP